MAYITLNEAKSHLNINLDWTDDDLYINSLIDMVETIIENHIHDSLSDLEEEGLLPKPVVHAMKLMIGNFYEHREPIMIGVNAMKLPYSFEYLLDNYCNRTIS